ncbi:hypothetical protein [Sphaerisporangium corydalis]|uniref:Uncharacterized protein n=1 Tax=Sphaerisporangium corydalis TaxID=1441875 RepID=A0ABV9EGF9_9ACTN|nr:hypothetical protein [Sphaerisporangium corydalis]
MTTAAADRTNETALRRGLAALASSWTDARGVERACYVVGAALLVAGVFHLGVFAVSGGPWEGPVSWRKPATFGLSFGLTLITITWVTSYLRVGPRTRTILLAVFAADCVVEVGGTTLQAWRHVPSHFNTETTVNRSVSLMLAVGGAVLVTVLVTFAAHALRTDPDQPPSMRLAIRAGFVTLLIGLASGAAMIARGVTLVNTGHQRLAYQLGGFLKPVHGISLHGILVLPALAWLLTRTSWTEHRRTRIVALAATCYGIAIAGALLLSLTT